MKVLTPDEMRAADAATFERLGLPARAVMESAGRHSAEYLVSEFSERLEQGVVILVGGGNNGGDGFVLARALLGIGISTKVFSLKPLDALSGETGENAKAYLSLGTDITELTERTHSLLESEVRDCGVLVDALFGTGVSSELRPEIQNIISLVNRITKEASVPVLSIDVPSGINAQTGAICGEAIRAHTTLSLQCLKLGQVLFPAADYCGETVCLDIGVAESFQEIAGVARELLTEQGIAELVQEKFQSGERAHKGTRGHLLVVGGSKGHYGAPKLSAHAALLSGAGLVTLALPRSAAEELGPKFMEIMCAALPDDTEGNFAALEQNQLEEDPLESLVQKKAAFVIGPGLGQGQGAEELLGRVLEIAKREKVPTLLDADALNLISRNNGFKQLLGPHVVLTPHPGEMSRLVAKSVEEIESQRVEVATELARSLDCYVILKGARSLLAAPSGSVWINPAAVSTLATGGSGDVLSGIIGALLARGGSSEDACKVGLFIHGAAGELCFHINGGEVGTLASDIASSSSVVLNTLSRMPFFYHGFVRPILPHAMQYLPQFIEGTLSDREA